MSGLLIIAIVALAVRLGAPLLAKVVAVGIGVVLIRRSRLIGQKLISARPSLASDNGATRAHRRLMRAHLRLALQQTALTSLLPQAMAGARELAR